MTNSNSAHPNKENLQNDPKIDNTHEENVGLSNTQVGGTDELTEGLTPVHRQNINEARIDEILVEDALDDKDYPTIRDIADDDAVEFTNDNNS